MLAMSRTHQAWLIEALLASGLEPDSLLVKTDTDDRNDAQQGAQGIQQGIQGDESS